MSLLQVSSKNIVERVLRLTIYDIDRHRRHNVIGHALYPLREHDYDNNERVVIWRDLEREVSESTSDRGEIQTSLCYNNHLERLTVGVIQGRQFKNFADNYNNADYYVKMCLLQQNKIIKTKKTEVVKRSTNPSFNESFTFKLPVSSLDIASISLTAMQHMTGLKDKTLGRVVLGSFMFARGKELDHWNEMVANQREQITDWHVLT
ncbi:Synaptotagmin-15 [Lamellibrachia satsuma]|nr:Synaptotagmin-15 [Lamellibrachia satsuma]